jgi:hypothetical protein
MWLDRVHYEGFQGVGVNCGNHVALAQLAYYYDLGCISIIVPSICQFHSPPQILCNHIVTVPATEHWLFV